MAAASPPVALRSRAISSSFALDVVLVVIFAIIGRTSHAEDLSATGIWQTAWPFLTGLIAGWLITRGWLAPAAPLRTGAGVWAITLVGGILLRAVSGQGVAVAFVIVAAIVLALFLIGWRAVGAQVRRARSRGEAIAK